MGELYQYVLFGHRDCPETIKPKSRDVLVGLITNYDADKLLVEKDWSAYQALFNDKVKFQQFFELINKYRTDAHAKDIDEEDEALLNIAFKFFEKALQDL